MLHSVSSWLSFASQMNMGNIYSVTNTGWGTEVKRWGRGEGGVEGEDGNNVLPREAFNFLPHLQQVCTGRGTHTHTVGVNKYSSICSPNYSLSRTTGSEKQEALQKITDLESVGIINSTRIISLTCTQFQSVIHYCGITLWFQMHFVMRKTAWQVMFSHGMLLIAHSTI